MLENYIALQGEINTLWIAEGAKENIIFEKLKRVPKDIREKFINKTIYKVNIDENSLEKFWNIIKKTIVEEDSLEDEQIVEVYVCAKDERKIIKNIIMNKGSNINPELEKGTHITIGRFVRGHEIKNSEKLEGENEYFHILSLSKDKNKLYVDIITRLNDSEFYNSNLYNMTRRENKLNNIKERHKWINKYKKIDENLVPSARNNEQIKINNEEVESLISRCDYYEKGRCSKHENFKNMLLRYYECQGRVPNYYKGQNFKIERIELKNTLGDGEIEGIEFSRGSVSLEYPIQKSMKIRIGDEECRTLEYINPHDNSRHELHINSINRLSDMIPEQYKEALKEQSGEIEETLVVLYENPSSNIAVNFYLKDYLDSKEEYLNGACSLVLMRNTKSTGKMGYKLLEKQIEGYKGHSDEVELELFSITNYIKKAPIKFEKGMNCKRTLEECVIDMSEDEKDAHKKIHRDFKHIRFTPENPTYCQGEHATFGDLIDYEKVNIPLGKSRIGGPVVDLPENVEYPKNFYFAAQLNLEKFSKFYINDYLPKTGFLYFFTDNYCEYGEVIYSDCKVEDLKRVIREHDQSFFSGNLIRNIYVDEENINKRYLKDAEEDNESKWDSFAGSEKSKLFGIYTNCQFCEEEIIDEILSEDLVLLQVGEDFTGCGVFTVRIAKSDLEKLDFTKCSFEWSQS